jgi:hypothetical protein
MLRFPPRIVGVLCTVQALTIVAAFMIARSLLKAYNTAIVPHWGELPHRFHWPLKLTLALGPWVLLVPLVWGITATLKADVEGGLPEITTSQSRIGYVLTFALVLLCASACLNALGLVFDPVGVRDIVREG